MTATTCTQPGCGGTITSDGFCGECGLAPVPAGAVPTRPSVATGGEGGSGGSQPDPFHITGGSSGSGVGSGGRGTGSRPTRGSRGSRGRTRRGLGGGLVDVPAVPASDPAAALLAHPEVPESRRFCGSCHRPVGRAAGGRPAREEGFCRNCGTKFSFAPKLKPGEMVARQYKVNGCLAHGGLGWIYLAQDTRVNDMWVVLKGLLDTGNADAREAAEVEREALSKVKHPNIVQVYNYVEHTSEDGETTQYIVMEYVGGKSLKQIRRDARTSAAGGVVPLPIALAYMIEILPAFGYLHDHNLVYCDFKPDNVIQSEEQLKLIDLGGVKRIDSDGATYGTPGYQAQEVDTGAEPPSPDTDLYTVGRSLAVLTFDFDFQGRYRYTLPGTESLLAAQESYARALRKATHADPGQRFATASEMTEQLTGVLREVLATGDGEPRPAFSSLFSPEPKTIGADLIPERHNGTLVVTTPPAAEIIAGLPVPLVDGSDPAAGYLATLGGLEPAAQADALLGAVTGDAGVPAAVSGSVETRLALARALIGTQDSDARSALASLAAEEPGDWRIAWYNGLLDLAAGNAASARSAFGAVFDELPGELAPKLALAFAAEADGDPATARRYFQLVWTVDRSYISAAFGLARACAAMGQRPAAVAALAAVPETSSQHAAAQIAAVRLLVAGGDGISADDLRQADGRLGSLVLDDMRRQQLTVEVLKAALDWVSGAAPGGASGAVSRGAPPGGAPPGGTPSGGASPDGASPTGASPGGATPAGGVAVATVTGKGMVAIPGDLRIVGCEPSERALRFGLERGYRMLASLTRDPARKVELVDMANEIRPRTWT